MERKHINKSGKREVNESKVNPKGDSMFTVLKPVRGPLHFSVPTVPVLFMCLE